MESSPEAAAAHPDRRTHTLEPPPSATGSAAPCQCRAPCSDTVGCRAVTCKWLNEQDAKDQGCLGVEGGTAGELPLQEHPQTATPASALQAQLDSPTSGPGSATDGWFKPQCLYQKKKFSEQPCSRSWGYVPLS